MGLEAPAPPADRQRGREVIAPIAYAVLFEHHTPALKLDRGAADDYSAQHHGQLVVGLVREDLAAEAVRAAFEAGREAGRAEQIHPR